jgi:hypothetical protein
MPETRHFYFAPTLGLRSIHILSTRRTRAEYRIDGIDEALEVLGREVHPARECRQQDLPGL